MIPSGRFLKTVWALTSAPLFRVLPSTHLWPRPNRQATTEVVPECRDILLPELAVPHHSLVSSPWDATVPETL